MNLWPDNTKSGPRQAEFSKQDIKEGQTPPDRGWIMRYQRSIRFTDWAMMRLFQDIKVMDQQGRTRPVPIIMGSQDRAVAAILGPNVRKDGSGVVDRIRLPMMALWPLDINLDESRFAYPMAIEWNARKQHLQTENDRNDTRLGRSRGIPIVRNYTLFAWTKYQETMNQISEQVLHKFRPTATLKVEGVDFEVPVYLDTIANTAPFDAPDGEERLTKMEFAIRCESMIANTWIREKIAKRVDISFSVDNGNGTASDPEQFSATCNEQSERETLEPI